MRFNRINISNEATKSKGISEINIQRLSNVIAFVGKNGSGKSRILDLIEENAFKEINIESIVENHVTCLPNELNEHVGQLTALKLFLNFQQKFREAVRKSKKDPANKSLRLEVRNFQTKLQTDQTLVAGQQKMNVLSQNFQQIVPTLKPSYLRRIRNSEIQQLQKAIGDNKDGLLPFENLIENALNNSGYDELKSIHKSALKYLEKLPHKLVSDKHECVTNGQDFEQRDSYKRFVSIKKFIKDFLGKELSWEGKTSNSSLTESGYNVTYQGIWKINDRDFNYTEFSDGEKTLFAYAILFFLLDKIQN